MTTPFWCLMVLALVPYLLAALGGYMRRKQFGVMDNHHPRIQNAQLTGVGARVWAAQLNAWEALSLFTATVVVAHLAGADPRKAAIASLVFVAVRIAHPILYIADLSKLRSTVATIGLISCAYQFWLAAA
jgi:uncharacterized MAPEG superfamily protein